MKFLFLITSALQTKFGVYSAEQRLEQTINTIDSVRQHVPADQLSIMLIETSGEEPAADALATVESRVDRVIRFTDDPWVAGLYASTNNWDVVKNATEIMAFGSVIKQLGDQGDLAGIDRIFKLSGRYCLTDDFNIDFYRAPALQDKIVIKHAMTSQFDPVITDGVTRQYMSRLWSFPAAQATAMAETYESMLQTMANRVKAGGYVDIEHLLFKYLNGPNVCEVPVIGVTGNLGPNGKIVVD